MGTLQINVLGTCFSIKASEDDEYLKNLLNYYSKIVSEIENSHMLSNQLHVSILAGIMLCDELYKEKSKNVLNAEKTSNKTSIEIEKKTKEMISKLESVLKNEL